MLNNIVRLPGQKLHFKEPKLGVDVIELVDHSSDAIIFLHALESVLLKVGLDDVFDPRLESTGR